MNVKLLRKIKRHILAEPLRFMMATWIRRKFRGFGSFTGDGGKRQGFAECGTAACIGGWAVILSKISDSDINMHSGSDIMSKASALLELSSSQAPRLFLTDYWPQPFRHDYNSQNTTPKTRARIAADRIEHLIKTGE